MWTIKGLAGDRETGGGRSCSSPVGCSGALDQSFHGRDVAKLLEHILE